MTINATGIFKANLKFQEATNEEIKNSNGSIIGKIVGEHFCPGGFSRNGRYYPEDETYGKLWSKQLENKDLQERIKSNVVFGTIGHALEIGEKELREGLASHFTTNHEVRKTGNPDKPFEGYAESFILNTPAGKCLKTYFEAGCNLYTSTRADGTYIEGKTKKTPEGKEVPVLDPNTFRYERNDFVINPGFLDANPKLKEELGESVLVSLNEAMEQGAEFDEKDNFSNDNEITKKDINQPSSPAGVPDQNKGDTGSSDAVKKGKNATDLSDKEGKTTEPDKMKKENSATEETISELLEKIEALETENSKYFDFGTCEEIESKLESLKKFEEIGTIEDVIKAMENSEGFEKIDSIKDEEIELAFNTIQEFFSEYGQPQEIKEQLTVLKEKLDSYEKFGITDDFIKEFEDSDVEKVKEAINSVSELIENYGDLNGIKVSLSQLKEFTDKFGSFEDAEKVLENAKKIAVENKAHKISENTGLDYEKVLKHLNQGMNEKEICDMYSKLHSSLSDRYLFSNTEEKVKEDAPSYVINENQSRLSRFYKK